MARRRTSLISCTLPYLLATDRRRGRDAIAQKGQNSTPRLARIGADPEENANCRRFAPRLLNEKMAFRNSRAKPDSRCPQFRIHHRPLIAPHTRRPAHSLPSRGSLGATMRPKAGPKSQKSHGATHRIREFPEEASPSAQNSHGLLHQKTSFQNPRSKLQLPPTQFPQLSALCSQPYALCSSPFALRPPPPSMPPHVSTSAQVAGRGSETRKGGSTHTASRPACELH